MRGNRLLLATAALLLAAATNIASATGTFGLAARTPLKEANYGVYGGTLAYTNYYIYKNPHVPYGIMTGKVSMVRMARAPSTTRLSLTLWMERPEVEKFQQRPIYARVHNLPCEMGSGGEYEAKLANGESTALHINTTVVLNTGAETVVKQEDGTFIAADGDDDVLVVGIGEWPIYIDSKVAPTLSVLVYDPWSDDDSPMACTNLYMDRHMDGFTYRVSNTLHLAPDVSIGMDRTQLGSTLLSYTISGLQPLTAYPTRVHSRPCVAARSKVSPGPPYIQEHSAMTKSGSFSDTGITEQAWLYSFSDVTGQIRGDSLFGSMFRADAQSVVMHACVKPGNEGAEPDPSGLCMFSMVAVLCVDLMHEVPDQLASTSSADGSGFWTTTEPVPTETTTEPSSTTAEGTPSTSPKAKTTAEGTTSTVSTASTASTAPTTTSASTTSAPTAPTTTSASTPVPTTPSASTSSASTVPTTPASASTSSASTVPTTPSASKSSASTVPTTPSASASSATPSASTSSASTVPTTPSASTSSATPSASTSSASTVPTTPYASTSSASLATTSTTAGGTTTSPTRPPTTPITVTTPTANDQNVQRYGIPFSLYTQLDCDAIDLKAVGFEVASVFAASRTVPTSSILEVRTDCATRVPSTGGATISVAMIVVGSAAANKAWAAVTNSEITINLKGVAVLLAVPQTIAPTTTSAIQTTTSSADDESGCVDTLAQCPEMVEFEGFCERPNRPNAVECPRSCGIASCPVADGDGPVADGDGPSREVVGGDGETTAADGSDEADVGEKRLADDHGACGSVSFRYTRPADADDGGGRHRERAARKSKATSSKSPKKKKSGKKSSAKLPKSPKHTKHTPNVASGTAPKAKGAKDSSKHKESKKSKKTAKKKKEKSLDRVVPLTSVVSIAGSDATYCCLPSAAPPGNLQSIYWEPPSTAPQSTGGATGITRLSSQHLVAAAGCLVAAIAAMMALTRATRRQSPPYSFPSEPQERVPHGQRSNVRLGIGAGLSLMHVGASADGSTNADPNGSEDVGDPWLDATELQYVLPTPDEPDNVEGKARTVAAWIRGPTYGSATSF